MAISELEIDERLAGLRSKEERDRENHGITETEDRTRQTNGETAPHAAVRERVAKRHHSDRIPKAYGCDGHHGAVMVHEHPVQNVGRGTERSGAEKNPTNANAQARQSHRSGLAG